MSKSKVQVVKRISSKSVGFSQIELNKLVAENPEGVKLYSVAGCANGLRSGEGAYGPWEALVGSFIAIRNDGTEFTSIQCFLPDPFHDVICNKVRTLSPEDPNSSVQFIIEVGVRPGTKPGVAYEFTAMDKQSVEMVNQMEDLRQKLLS